MKHNGVLILTCAFRHHYAIVNNNKVMFIYTVLLMCLVLYRYIRQQFPALKCLQSESLILQRLRHVLNGKHVRNPSGVNES